jgi:deoxyribodipyrimidine photo-lyase
LTTITTSVVWFRRDLRIDDHPALAEACAAGAVLALFVVDPAFASSGRPRQQALAQALASLQAATGGALVLRHGDPVDVVPAVAAEVDAGTVFVSKDAGPYGRRRDAAVAAVLKGDGRALRGIGSPYAVEPGTVLSSTDTAYSVFTPFARRWRQVGWSAPIDAPSRPEWIEVRSDPLAHDLDHGSVGALPLPEWSRRWADFTSGPLEHYDTARDLPAVDGTSRLSPHLRFGLVHPRQLLAVLDPANASHETFAMELAWRDFYADVLLREPRSAWENFDRRFDRIAVDTDAAARQRFEHWCRGLTGFPIVDAGMRQLAELGWVHNRVRMIVASFLVKDLHLPWQWGAAHFMRHLVDGDLASNNHGWQWAAGSGTDAAPYFRVFNPTAQMERYDPDGEYVARWVPEFGSSTYPAPIVDHATERREALTRYEAIKR